MNVSSNHRVKSLRIWMVSLALLGVVAWAQDSPKRVTRAEAMGAAVTKAPPDYPAIAKQLKLQGAVELEVSVSENGEVTKVEIVKGNPILTLAAAQAVKHWKFKPFMEDGKAVAVLAPIEVEFKL
jgi:protein TonB